jgi:tRNA-guanine family transglycosylase
MKIFLSWSPVPPDPPYWKWLSVDGIVVSIALLKQRRMLERATLLGLHDLLDFGGEIFLDSGSYEDVIAGKRLRPKSPVELLVLAKWLGVDFVAHLDFPFVGKNAELPEEEKWVLLKQNIINAKISSEWSKNNRSKTQVVYVIQGWDRESLIYCCEELAKLDEGHYAIGSLARIQPKEIEYRVRLVRKLIGDPPKLHLFAVSSPSVVSALKSYVDSIDSSTASISGAMKEIMKPSGGRSHMDKIGKIEGCNCPVCQEYKGAIFLQGKRGSQNYYNQLRKVHNAYQLMNRLKKICSEL